MNGSAASPQPRSPPKSFSHLECLPIIRLASQLSTKPTQPPRQMTRITPILYLIQMTDHELGVRLQARFKIRLPDGRRDERVLLALEFARDGVVARAVVLFPPFASVRGPTNDEVDKELGDYFKVVFEVLVAGHLVLFCGESAERGERGDKVQAIRRCVHPPHRPLTHQATNSRPLLVPPSFPHHR